MNETKDIGSANNEDVQKQEEEMRALEARLAELRSKTENARGVPERDTNALLIPGSILLAGIIISIAVVYGGGSMGPKAPMPSAATPPPATANPLDAMRAISDADHYRGNLNAPVKIVEYSDPECPFCKQFHNTLKQVMAKYGGNVLWVYRHFPLDGLHPKARKEAEAMECAYELSGNDGFWKFTDRIYEVTPSNNGLDPAELPKIAQHVGLDVNKFTACLSSGKYASKIEADYQNAVATGGQGTPHSIVIAPNGDKVPLSGAQPLASVTQMIDTALTLKAK